MSTLKRKLTNKSLKEKCDIVHHIEKGMANKKPSEKPEVLKNTISTWMKKKEKLFSPLQETSSFTKINCICNHQEVDNAVYDCFILQRSLQIPIDSALIREKARFFAETLKFLGFKASDWWMEKWKKRYKKLNII